MAGLEQLIDMVESDTLRKFFRFLNTQAVDNIVTGFVNDHCAEFDPDFDIGPDSWKSAIQSGEHKLEYQELHMEYKRLVDEILDEFCDDNEMSSETLLKECAACDSDSVGGAMLEMFLSAQDYLRFCNLMTEASRQRRRRMREEKTSPRSASKSPRARAREGKQRCK
jgi:hypothetical protein